MSEKTDHESVPAAGVDVTDVTDPVDGLSTAAEPASLGDQPDPPDMTAQSQEAAPEGLDSDDEFDEDADGFGDEGGDETVDGPAPSRGRASRPTKSRTAQLEREGEVAADFLERLLDIADLDGDIDVDIDGDRASVAIVDSEDGRVPRSLVGHEARVLEALQDLTRMAVQAATGERSRLMLDVAGHRARRRDEIVELTRVAIEEVRSSGRPAPLKPMSAFERKVAHDEVLAAGFVSESEGTEPHRHVVVLPA